MLTALLLAPAPALAAPGQCSAKERKDAGALADKAFEQFEAADYRAAIDSFGQAEEKCHSPRLLVFIARAHMGLGELLRARDLLQQAASEPLTPRSPPSFREAQTEARKELDALKPRIPVIQVTLSGTSTDVARATVNGEETSLETLQQGLDVDPGKYTVRVEAPGVAPTERRLILRESRVERLEIVLQPQETTAPPPPESTSSSLAPTIAAFSVGALGLGLGVVTGVMSSSAVSDIKSRCNGNDCLKSDEDAAARAGTLGNLSTAGFILGGLGVATGAVLLIVRASGGGSDGEDDTEAEPSTAIRIPEVQVGIGPGSILLHGRF
ncbi:hypothetical protein [Chondromyces apiculatus]|uniref:PEGA domain-containing protein n=1 Tax=Chondromyces apiculatus DSM 436 TaxID=1192034 RepID=A0A017TFZ1_9BACT|nr:hypothetical protein [Chondromyces apiculatus]EYF07511.1 Hypothetical protein CAP_0264 [Chondromyces apiculatus DSM 436]